MRTVIALALIALLAVSTTSHAAKTAGEDNGPDTDETHRLNRTQPHRPPYPAKHGRLLWSWMKPT